MSVEIIGERPLLRILSDGKRMLMQEFRIVVDGNLIVVPKGFITDLSSYPGLTRAIVRFDRVDIAGIVHDWLYKTGVGGRSYADRMWRKIAMAGEKRANAPQAWVSWVGLRIFGWLPYWNHKRKRPEWRR